MKHHQRIRIVSMFGLADPSTGRKLIWEGLVPEWRLSADATDEEICEAVFRLFNRVTDADADRLEAWNYRMPSVSCGDIIGIDKGEAEGFALYRVASVGFNRIYPGLS